MAHDTRQFTFDGRPMWFHLDTSSLNVFLAKKTWARCWTRASPKEGHDSGLRDTIPGSHMRLELHHHKTFKRAEADNVNFREVYITAAGSYSATALAQLTLPDGQVISVQAGT